MGNKLILAVRDTGREMGDVDVAERGEKFIKTRKTII